LGRTFVYVTHDQVEAMSMATRVALLSGGRVEQVGTPTEVYDTPASVFVAGFLGAPPMNLLAARIEAAGPMLTVQAPGLRLPLWPGTAPQREVTLGIRPESLRRIPAGNPTAEHHPDAEIDGVVTAIENLGSEEVAWCDVHGQALALRGPRPIGLAIGDRTRLGVDPARVHLFDRASGRRLTWQQPTDQPTVTAAVAAGTPVLPDPTTATPAAAGV
ncbi:TOBE domain-containing protein, partial [Frankia sp. AvcI1]